MTGVWVTNDVISATRMNEKTIFQGTGAAISGITTYAGMLVFCTSSGSGFIADTLYKRNAANTSWSPLNIGQSGDQVYPLNTTSGDYAFGSSAVASSVYTNSASYSDNFSSDNFTDTGSGINVSGGVLNWTADRTATTSNTYDDLQTRLGVALDSTAFVIRFKLVISTYTPGSDTDGEIIYFTVSTLSNQDYTSSGDHVGMFIFATTSAATIDTINYNGAGLPAGPGVDTFATVPSATTYYVEWIKSGDDFTTNLYSDSGFSTLIESEVSTVSGVTGLRYFRVVSLHGVNKNHVITGTIDDLQIWNGVTTTGSNPASNILDGNTGTSWRSASENNPNIYFDLGAAKEFHALMLNIDKTNTTETEIQIRASTDTTFTSGETVRTILISDFTDDTNRFLTIPRAITDKRYVQIYGSSNSVALAINEAKYLTKSAADFEKGHFHYYLSPTNTSSNTLDSN